MYARCRIKLGRPARGRRLRFAVAPLRKDKSVFAAGCHARSRTSPKSLYVCHQAGNSACLILYSLRPDTVTGSILVHRLHVQSVFGQSLPLPVDDLLQWGSNPFVLQLQQSITHGLFRV